MARKKVSKKKALKRIPYGRESKWYDKEFGKDVSWVDYNPTCHDCGVPAGKLHDSRCDVEECPICHKQLLSCGHAEMVWGPKEKGFGGYETRLLNIPKGFR